MDKNSSSNIKVPWFIIIIGLVIGFVLLFLAIYYKKNDGNEILVLWLNSLSNVIIVSLSIGSLLNFTAKKKILSNFNDATNIIIKNYLNKTLNNSIKYGFTGIADEFDVKKIIQDLEIGDELLWLDTYIPGHVQWLDILRQKINLGVKFKFLILDFDSNMVSLRGNEIGGRFERNFKQELTIFSNDLNDLQNEDDNNSISVKFYSDLLACPFYIIKKANGSPDKAITSFYLRQATGIEFPHMEWVQTKTKNFVTLLNDYFDWKWDNASEKNSIHSPKKT